jgi:beta-lactamase regulating signal transducer with metallopeptidase domain
MHASVEMLNHWGDSFLSFAWPMLWQSSLLIAIVFAFDFLTAKKIRASIRYALWMVVLVKLILPPALALPTSATWWLWRPSPVIETPLAQNYTVTVDETAPLANFVPQTVPIALPPPKLNDTAWMMLISVTVGTGLLLWLAFRWLRIARKVHHVTTSVNFAEILEATRRLARLRRPMRLRLIDSTLSPAVYGLFRPVILLPLVLTEKLSRKQLRAVLLHEAIHLRRGDVWVNCAQTFLQIAYWWHPLLWFANARIRRVREEAVDDAVMVALNTDADAYAPTLLEVAKLAFRRPLASLGLVGIMESRSALRQRIERLIDFHPPRKAGLTLLSLFGIFIFSAVALPMGQGPASENDSQSPQAGNIQTNSTDPAANNSNNDFAPEEKSDELLQEGESFYEKGLFDEAQLKMNQALSINPGNSEAYYYSLLIKDSKARSQSDPTSIVRSFKLEKPMPEQDLKELLLKAGIKIPPVIVMFGNDGIILVRGTDDQQTLVERIVRKLNGFSSNEVTNDDLSEGQKSGLQENHQQINQVISNPERKIIYHKLEHIQFNVDYNNSPLDEVLRDLTEQSRKNDPDNKGVRFLFDPLPVPGTLDPATGMPQKIMPTPKDIRITMRIKNNSLERILYFICMSTSPQVQYLVKTDSVVFFAKGAFPSHCVMRTFKVDPKKYYSNLHAALPSGPSISNLDSYFTSPKKMPNNFGMSSMESPDPNNVITVLSRQYFTRMGLNLDPPKTLFFNDRLGVLFVYATPQDLDVIERAIQVLNYQPPQVHLKARFIEVPSFFADYIPAGLTNGTGVLTQPDFQVFLHQVELQKGVQEIAEPEVTMTSGRQVQMRAEMIHPMLIDSPKLFDPTGNLHSGDDLSFGIKNGTLQSP